MTMHHWKTEIPTLAEMESAWTERFSTEHYDKFKHAEVGIAGLGGLGSNIAVMLARTGIGHLHLVDFDRVDITNLNRQAYRMSQLGRFKTDALKEILEEINPYLKITTDTVFVKEDNAVALFETYPLVCEAFDKAENKAMLVNTLLDQCPEMKIVSGSGMAGYGSSNTIQTRKLMRNLYLCGDGVTDIMDVIVVTSPRVSICAGHQANMIIRLILGMDTE